jgi:hypothetical protein
LLNRIPEAMSVSDWSYSSSSFYSFTVETSGLCRLYNNPEANILPWARTETHKTRRSNLWRPCTSVECCCPLQWKTRPYKWEIDKCSQATRVGCTFCWSCRWGEIMSLICGHKRIYCSAPRWYMSPESHGGMILTGENRRTRRKFVPVPHCLP